MDTQPKPTSPSTSTQNNSDGSAPPPQPINPAVFPSAESTPIQPVQEPQSTPSATSPQQTINPTPVTTSLQQTVPGQPQVPSSPGVTSPFTPSGTAEPNTQTGGVVFGGGGSTASASYTPAPTGEKSFMAAFLLALFLGGLGADRYYLGKIGTGLLKMFTFGGFLIWAFVDLIFILSNKTKDKNGNPLEGYEKHHKTAVIIFVAVMILNIITGLTTAYLISQAAKSVSDTVDTISDLAKDCPEGKCITSNSSNTITPLGKEATITSGESTFSVSILRPDPPPQTTGDAADEGMQYVVVNFLIEYPSYPGASNTSLPGMFYYKTPDGKFFNDVSVIDEGPTISAKDVRLTESYMAMLGSQPIKPGEINPNNYLIFHVPKGDLGQVVWFENRFDTNSPKLATFDLK